MEKFQKKKYDTFIIGHISKDENVYKNESVKEIGGAILYSSYSASAGGNRVGVLTKTAVEEKSLLNIFSIPREDIYYISSNQTTSIRNEYLSENREKRICTALSIADPYKNDEVPDVESRIYHLAGLIAGDFENELIRILSEKGKVAVDVQGFLRNVINNQMLFKDWNEKTQYLPYIHFLKTDAAEAEVMTGHTDIRQAAKILHGWGAKEVMITCNSEVIIYNGKNFYARPLKPRNLSGRSGRGDTCFSAYITERINKDINDSLLYAAALTSLKMEKPSPFKGTRKDVEDYIRDYYCP